MLDLSDEVEEIDEDADEASSPSGLLQPAGSQSGLSQLTGSRTGLLQPSTDAAASIFRHGRVEDGLGRRYAPGCEDVAGLATES